VYDHEPDPGFEMISVVIYMISGSNEGSGVGSPNFHEFWRVQLSIYHTDATECGTLAVKVSNTILSATATMESDYGIRNLQKRGDSDVARQDPNVHEFQIVQDYTFETDLDTTVDASP
jgi:hypothetical protein